MKQRASHKEIMHLIETGQEHKIPKSKTWMRFKEYRRDARMGLTTMAKVIGIPLTTMEKFAQGTYIISPSNLKLIQKYLDSVGA